MLHHLQNIMTTQRRRGRPWTHDAQWFEILHFEIISLFLTNKFLKKKLCMYKSMKLQTVAHITYSFNAISHKLIYQNLTPPPPWFRHLFSLVVKLTTTLNLNCLSCPVREIEETNLSRLYSLLKQTNKQTNTFKYLKKQKKFTVLWCTELTAR